MGSGTAATLGACALIGVTVIACASIAGIDNPNGGNPDEPFSQQTPPQERETEPGKKVDSPSHLEGDVEIEPNALEFGAVTCGVESAPQKITIRNTTDAAVTYNAVLPQASGFALKGPPSGSVPAKGSVSFDITALPTTASEVNGGVIINAGKSYLEVLTHTKGVGAVLELVPSEVDFGEIRKGTVATPLPVEIKNTGTGPAIISGIEGKTTNLDATWSPSGDLTIPANESAVVNATFTAPQVGQGQKQVVTATLKPTVTSALCAPVPELKSKGTSVDQTVTLSTADFGMQACNSTPTNRDVTISNFAPSTITVTDASFVQPSRFSIVTTFPLQIGPGGAQPATGKITIAANPTGVNLTAATEELSLNITGVDPPDGGTRKTTARIDVRGAILEINPNLLTFSSTGGYTDDKEFPIKNTGNSTITVSYDFARPVGPPAWYPEKSYHQIGPNQTFKIDMGFRPSYQTPDGTQHEATLTPKRYSGAQSCTPMPVATAKGTKL